MFILGTCTVCTTWKKGPWRGASDKKMKREEEKRKKMSKRR
jgi:hypothetical protein